jgi:serine/threonine protein phosphatase PrpC
MSFFRKLFRGNAPQKPQEQPADAPPPAATTAPPDAEAPAEASWWASSAPADEQPAAQAEVSPAVEPGPEADTLPVDDEPSGADEPDGAARAAHSETPTAPFSALTEATARTRLDEERASDVTPPEGTPLLAEGAGDSTRQLDAASAPALSPRRSAQGLAATAARDIGRVREVNQDSVFAMLASLPREGGDVTVGLFIVADGMGGHQGGEVASRLAVRTVVHQVLSQLVLPALDDGMTEALQPLMTSAVQAANEAIWEAAQTLGSDMGTTCTAALLVGHSLYIAHVGDSRAYLFEPGGLRALTADHSTVGRLIQVGQLDPSEAREHPLRNQLYRTVGQQPQVQVDFVYQPVGQSSHLLLCSDGLWGLIEEPLMEQALGRSPWPQDACAELIALANLAGGDDNISAVVVSLPMALRADAPDVNTER